MKHLLKKKPDMKGLLPLEKYIEVKGSYRAQLLSIHHAV
jgi:hypothetical protein